MTIRLSVVQRLGFVLILLILFLVGEYLLILFPSNETPPFRASVLTSSSAPMVSLPARLRIPRLRIDALIVSVGLTPKGNMDIPARADQIGWFSPGAMPGEKGNAVMAGHLDTVAGTRGVFWDLKKLVAGDDVSIEDAAGRLMHFQVTASQAYSTERFPLRQVFGTASGAQLQLITCNGLWNRDAHSYDKRLVVTAELTKSLSDIVADQSGKVM